jgi:hypothetical protein
MALGTSQLVPLPVFAHTLNAMLGEVHRPNTSSDTPTFLEAGHIWTRLSSSTASNSIKANTPAEPVETSVYADVYLYVQALCYAVDVLAIVLLAASISIVTYVEALLLRLVQWIRLVVNSMLPDSPSTSKSLWDILLPDHGMPIHEVLPRYKHWWSSMDTQQHDIMCVERGLADIQMYVSVVQHASTHYLPYWLCKALMLGYCWLLMPPIARPRQKARILAALWLAAKLLCAYTDVPLPASGPRTLRVLGLLSCLAPPSADEDVQSVWGVVVLVATFVLMWWVAAINVVLQLAFDGFCHALIKALRAVAFLIRCWRKTANVVRSPLRAVLAGVSCVCSVVAKGSSLLVMLGAAEMLAVSAVAQWWRAQRAKLHVKYKYVRRIWRRTGGNVGSFLWQLLRGIESSPASGGAASGGRSGSKAGSKRGGKHSAAKSSGGTTSNSSSSAVRLQDTAAVHSSVSSAYAADARSSSSNDQEEEDESLADLLTLSPAASVKSNTSTNKQAQGKQSSAKTAKQAAKSATAASRQGYCQSYYCRHQSGQTIW